MKKQLLNILFLLQFIPNAYAVDNAALAAYRDEDGNSRNGCYDTIMYMWFMNEVGKTATNTDPNTPSDASITRVSNNLVRLGLVPTDDVILAKKMSIFVFSAASTAQKNGNYKNWEETTVRKIKSAQSVCTKAMEKAVK